MVPVPVLLAGPTGSGKSAVAMHLAPLLRGEIISADSMQVFRGMDVGTAKPTPEERARVRHHLLDLVSPAEDFDAARWLAAAEEAVDGVRARGGCALICGGTGLYFSAWLRGLDAPAPADPRLRAALEARPLAELLAELKDRDARVHEAIDRANPRRVVRALEILRLGGQPLRRTAAGTLPPPSLLRGALVILRREAPDLRARIERRVDAMVASGLVEEVRELRAQPGGLGRTAAQAIGYRQVLQHLEGGMDFAAMVAEVKTRTWQFARRQGTWFRNQFPWARVVEVAEQEPAEQTAARLAEWVRNLPPA